MSLMGIDVIVLLFGATLNKDMGKTAIRSFIVEKGTPGFTVARLEKKLGIRASDTATLIFDNCRIPRENLAGVAKKRLRLILMQLKNHLVEPCRPLIILVPWLLAWQLA